MNPLTYLKRTILLIPTAIVLACFGLSPQTRAVLPAPDGGYPNGNTAEGQNALFSLTTGALNTALGGAALFFLPRPATTILAVGFEAAAFNTTGEANTATGAYALLHNTTGQRQCSQWSSRAFFQHRRRWQHVHRF